MLGKGEVMGGEAGIKIEILVIPFTPTSDRPPHHPNYILRIELVQSLIQNHLGNLLCCLWLLRVLQQLSVVSQQFRHQNQNLTQQTIIFKQMPLNTPIRQNLREHLITPSLCAIPLIRPGIRLD